MKSCGKRLFTLACKARSTADWRGATRIKNMSGSVIAGPLIFLFFNKIFCFVWRGRFSRGFWGKGVFWCGDFVVRVWWIAW